MGVPLSRVSAVYGRAVPAAAVSEGATQLMQRASTISRTVATTRRPLCACLAAVRGRKG